MAESATDARGSAGRYRAHVIAIGARVLVLAFNDDWPREGTVLEEVKPRIVLGPGGEEIVMRRYRVHVPEADGREQLTANYGEENLKVL